MHPQEIFKTNVQYKELLHDNGAHSWVFNFENDVAVSSEGFWRLLQDQEIVWVSMDHGHKFGLPAPVDLVNEVNMRLLGTALQEIEICEGTGDLKLRLSSGYMIEIFIASTGYETWNFSINGKHYIGMGGGEYAFY